VESFFKFCFFVSLIILPVIYGKKYLTKIWKENEESSEGTFWTFFIVLLLAGIPFIIGIANIIDNLKWIQIWIAPKVYLLEYVANFVK